MAMPATPTETALKTMEPGVEMLTRAMLADGILRMKSTIRTPVKVARRRATIQLKKRIRRVTTRTEMTRLERAQMTEG